LTPEAEQLFPKAYGAILIQLLDVLNERLTSGDREDILREVGRRIAASQPAPAPEADLQQRIQMVIDVYRQLGGLAEVEERDGRTFIRGDSCPLAAVSAHHPQICRFAETMVSEIMQIPVQERCKHGATPQCCFEIIGKIPYTTAGL
jgi:predicted ArsR family transcriptional regulator